MPWQEFSTETANLIDLHLSPNVRRYLELTIPAILARKPNEIHASTIARSLNVLKKASSSLQIALINGSDISEKSKRLKSLLEFHHRGTANLIEGAAWAAQQPGPFVIDFGKRPDVLDSLTSPEVVASFISMIERAQQALASKQWVLDRFHVDQTVLARITLRAMHRVGMPLRSGINSEAVNLLDAVLRDVLGDKSDGARDQLRQWRKEHPG